MLLTRNETGFDGTYDAESKLMGLSGIDIGQLAQKVYDHFPNFKVKKLGYATFQKLVHSIRALQVENVGNNQKNVYLKR